ncbi:hypothetical protein UFOVP847_15 [uncultured Caudovirales phage]|uniref:Uncharacterized protein n=1 Tax=uncultured Caudovirales phage TaxID=2100421 RepID=A0A6J5PAS6_9CAUD|nr:hypothetical protein UFOVP847_15 [uncultured Caudovirales phage]
MIGRLVGALIGRKVKEKIADAVLDKVNLPDPIEGAIKVAVTGNAGELLANIAGKAGADQDSIIGTVVKKTGKKK